MKKYKKIIIGILVILLIGSAITIYKNKNTKSAKKEEVKPVLTVVVHKPFFKLLPKSLELQGNVNAWQESFITSEIANVKINEVHVDVGNEVRKGQLLIRLDSSTIRAEYNQAKGTYLEALANLNKAKDEASRARNISKTNALSQQQINQYFSTEAIAEAQVEKAKAGLELQQLRLDRTNIFAPDDGIVSERKATVGSIVSQTELLKIIRQQRLMWNPILSSEQLSLVKVGQEVSIVTNSGEKINAKIDEISPIVDAQNRQGSLLIYLNKNQHKDKIKAGMFISGNVLIGESKTMLIDQQAVVLRDGFNYAFILSKDNKVIQTKISTGANIDNYIEVKSGLKENDNVVVTGAMFLNDSDLVKVVEK